jgi:ParB family chromosome partitioning protein
MDVTEIKVDLLEPNPWNVNRMSPGMMKKLAAYLKREGLVEPMVVRPHPTRSGRYEILGGFHRWSICREQLGYETVPCVIVDLNDKRAKILSVNLNSMSGQTVPSLLSNLLHDLEQEMLMPDLEATLPFDQGEITDYLSLMQVPEGFADELEQEARQKDRDAPEVVTIVLDRKQHGLWEQAVEAAQTEVGGARNPKARTLELLATRYLGQKCGGSTGEKSTGPFPGPGS